MDEISKKSFREYQKKYYKKNYYVYMFRINQIKNKDIVEKLQSINNKSEYLKSLIAMDIKKENDHA